MLQIFPSQHSVSPPTTSVANLQPNCCRPFRIGVNGFENPLRDPKTAEFKLQIGAGCKMKMDETGNILIKRFSERNVYVKVSLFVYFTMFVYFSRVCLLF